MMDKACKTCGKVLPNSLFNKKGNGQLRAHCKPCSQANQRLKYAADQAYRESCKARTIRNAPNAQRLALMPPGDAAQIRHERANRKKMGRLQALPGYKPCKHESHVEAYLQQQAFAVDCTAHVTAWRKFKHENEHDAHVRDFARRQRWKARDAMPATRTRRIARRAKHREELSDSYIVRLLTDSRKASAQGAGIPAALIDLKRVHMKLVRHLNLNERNDE